MELDDVIVDEKEHTLASIILITWKPSKPVLGFEPLSKPLRYTEQHFNWFLDGKLSKTITMPDLQTVHRQLSDPTAVYTPDLMRTQPEGKTGDASLEPSGSETLREIYRAYIDCINARDMTANLHKFVHSHVIFNGTTLTLDEYRQKLDAVNASIPDLFAVIFNMVADERTQRIAVQLESTGVLVQPLAGMNPTGKEVRFAEHCIYQIRDGKIARLWSLANWGHLGQTRLE